MNVVLFGQDASGSIYPVNIDASGRFVLSNSGTVPTSGTVGINGTIPVSGTISIQGTVPTSPGGTIPVSGTVGVSGTIPIAWSKGVATLSAAAPTASAGTILAANAARKSALLRNNGTQTVYLGTATNVTSSNGFPLDVGDSFEDDRSTGVWCGITAAGTADIRIVEVA